MTTSLSRRDWLQGTVAAGAGLAAAAAPAEAAASKEAFMFGFNPSTIRGQNLTIVQQVELAAKAGYQGFEPWARDLDTYLQGGGNLKDLGKRIADQGLRVESAIGFAEWIVDDDAKRAKGLEQARLDMDHIAQIGGKRIAAPPAGAKNEAGIDLRKAAQRYRQLHDLGQSFGVVPQIEIWGPSKTLSRLSEAMFVALESGHANACVLTDVYHLYKGGSGFQTFHLVGAPALKVIHFNDYPAQPSRAEITDAHRVYPGDGVAPLVSLLHNLRDMGFQGMLSLELFNRKYWQQDPLHVARTGLEKMKAVVQRSRETR